MSHSHLPLPPPSVLLARPSQPMSIAIILQDFQDLFLHQRSKKQFYFSYVQFKKFTFIKANGPAMCCAMLRFLTHCVEETQE